MTIPTQGSIPQRRPLANGPSLSLLSLTVLPPPVPGAAGERSVVERLRQARIAGVTTFDVAGSGDPRQAEHLLSEAFPEVDPGLVVIVRRQFDDLIHRGDRAPPLSARGDDLLDRLRHSFVESNRRLAPNCVGIVEWTGDGFPSTPEWQGTSSGLLGPNPPWLCRRVKEGDSSLPPETDHRTPSRLFSGALSLLDSRLVSALQTRAETSPVAFLARDPFAGGRLDGTRASGTGVERGPGTGPVRLRELQEEFGPVLRLASLTAHRRRTMAQAAIRFAAQWPWMGSVLVPLPTADRWREVLGTFDTPPLSDEELRLVAPVRGADHPADP